MASKRVLLAYSIVLLTLLTGFFQMIYGLHDHYFVDSHIYLYIHITKNSTDINTGISISL